MQGTWFSLFVVVMVSHLACGGECSFGSHLADMAGLSGRHDKERHPGKKRYYHSMYGNQTPYPYANGQQASPPPQGQLLIIQNPDGSFMIVDQQGVPQVPQAAGGPGSPMNGGYYMPAGVYAAQVVPGTPGHPVQAIPQQPLRTQATATYYHPAAVPPPGPSVFVFTPSSVQPGAEVTPGYSGLQLRQQSQYGYSYPGTTSTPTPPPPASYGYPVFPAFPRLPAFSDSVSVSTEDSGLTGVKDSSSSESTVTPADEAASESEEGDKTSRKSKVKKGILTGLGVAATLAAAAAAAKAVKGFGGTRTSTAPAEAGKTELDDGYRPPPFNPRPSPYAELLKDLERMRKE
ncbi:dense granule protein GRA4 [Toxoplasma gondii GAB2-2007-GAL-DOM2]|uniref:Dense granule protein GRA4 n=1 Tax=Toxoplasma gondii GAB2-2007-GAL-DOM2 TaxID=1130820 RepID=A0A086KJ99_TOXGO|nr:dense granule protein GRA4 [Toxoplasma gondii GAB2-2007-GAL-DOM2]